MNYLLFMLIELSTPSASLSLNVWSISEKRMINMSWKKHQSASNDLTRFNTEPSYAEATRQYCILYIKI